MFKFEALNSYILKFIKICKGFVLTESIFVIKSKVTTTRHLDMFVYTCSHKSYSYN